MDGRFVSVMRWRATPHCNRSCAGVASPGFFAARRAACARGHCTPAAPTKARPGPRASHSRAAWHPDPHAHVGARAMQPNTAQQHARAATRTGMAGDRRVCSLRGGRELPARAGLGINLGGGGSARACAYACLCGYADASCRPRVQSPGIKPAACAFVGAEAVRWPRPRSAQKEACGACENPAAA